jgi:hypothetical protein
LRLHGARAQQCWQVSLADAYSAAESSAASYWP